MKKLSSRNKIIIAFASLGVFVVAGIISLVLVLAAGQQNVQSNINVTYVSNNVAAQVTAKYWYTGSSKTAMGTTTFNASEQTRTATMSPSAIIELTADNNKVVFEYAFKNLSKDAAFTVELINSPKITANGAQTVNFTNMNEQYYVSAVEVPTSTLKVMDFSNTLNVQPIMGQREGQNDTVYIYVVASIDNLSNNAAYNGTFAWELNYVAPANIKTINLNNGTGAMGSSTMQVVKFASGTVYMPCINNFQTIDGTSFSGYFSASSEGTKYIALNGSPVRANDLNDGATLYAQWIDLTIDGSGLLTSLSLTAAGQTELNIPEGVTGIDDGVFQNNTTIQIVNLPTTLVSIGDSAFEGCTNLQEVNFDAVGSSRNLTYTGESNLESIGQYAFKNCTSLTEIEIPGSTTTLSTTMFSGCTSLVDITAPIYSKDYFTGLTNISLTINGTETNIGNQAFYGYTSLTSITIPSGVTSIGSQAFRLCYSLTRITIPNSVTSIGSEAFSYCYSLTRITIPNSVTSIGNYAFYSSHNLFEVYNLSSLSLTMGSSNNGYLAYYAKVIHTSLSEPSCIQTDTTNNMSYYVNGADYICLGFASNRSTSTTAVINNSCKKINNYAFSDCIGLTRITIPNSVTSIGNYAFYDCNSLTSATIGSGVTSIGSYAFSNCSSLTSITIPSSVTSIGEDAFSDCTSLTRITIPSSVTSIGEYVFGGCTSLTSITIPNSVTSIGQSAFYNCSSLTSVTIGSGVTSIGNSAFRGCTSLTSITIPSSVTRIGSYAFYNCTNLASVTFADGTSTWTISSSANGGGTVSTSSWAPSTTSSNATALKTTYYNKYWKKNS